MAKDALRQLMDKAFTTLVNDLLPDEISRRLDDTCPGQDITIEVHDLGDSENMIRVRMGLGPVRYFHVKIKESM